MLGEIFSTGDEIRTGALVDTNSAYLADKLYRAGITVTRLQCVGDDVDLLSAVLKEIGDRADVALVTGGLGPTTDDLTALAAAMAKGVDLELNHVALESVKAFFASKNRRMPESNKKQAMVPKGSGILKNSVGTAPGFYLKIGKCMFYFMPGVPFEMKKMFKDRVLPSILSLKGGAKSYNFVRTISTFGMTESLAGEKVANVSSYFPAIKLGLRAKFPEIQIKLYAKGNDESFLKEELDKACAWVKDKMGDKVFSVVGESMEEVVGKLLLRQRKTVAIAESCTGGLVANRLTDISGSSEYFLFSGVTYSNEAKINVLGVPAQIIEKHGAVSKECVKEMAKGVRKISGADYGLSISGIAGPGGGTKQKPVGTVCMGLATPDKIRAYGFLMQFATRKMNKSMFAMKALDIIRRELEKSSRTDNRE